MRYALAITLLLSMGAVSAVAQSSRLIAEVPFSFQAGNKTFSAGEYTVTRANDYGNRLLIRGKDGQGAFLPSATPLQSADLQTRSKLVFNRTDNGYVLAQVWIAGRNIGAQYAAPSASMRQVMASAKAKADDASGQ